MNVIICNDIRIITKFYLIKYSQLALIISEDFIFWMQLHFKVLYCVYITTYTFKIENHNKLGFCNAIL